MNEIIRHTNNVKYKRISLVLSLLFHFNSEHNKRVLL